MDVRLGLDYVGSSQFLINNQVSILNNVVRGDFKAVQLKIQLLMFKCTMLLYIVFRFRNKTLQQFCLLEQYRFRPEKSFKWLTFYCSKINKN